MEGRVLSPQQDQLLKEERAVLIRIAGLLARLDAPKEQQQALARSIEQLDDLFLLVVVGEFNAGKSAFINALLGQRLLTEGVTPTTARITLVRHGALAGSEDRPGGLTIVTAPVPLLEDLHIVDTPGTNAILREHEALTTEFVPRSDVVIFLTSADRPFTETERAFMETIRDWGKKVVVVINKLDILDGAPQVNEVRAFVEASARTLLGTAPPVFGVSARLALRAKEGEPAHWAASGFGELERYLRETLDHGERIRLKLLNPVGVGTALAERAIQTNGVKLDLLKDDFETLERIDQQLAMYREDMARDFTFRMADVDKILLEVERRGNEFFDDTLRIGRIMDLFNKSRVQQGFEQQVVADAPQQIERKVGELIDWLVEADLRQWQAVTGYLAERRRQHAGKIVGDAEIGRFDYDRRRLLESVGREAQRVVDTYDRRKEAQALANAAHNAVATTAAVGAGALGIGALVTAAATTAAADITGILMASLVAAIGFFVIPARRRKGKEEMRRKLTDVREKLSDSLREQFLKEIDRSGERIRQGIAPYTRFIRAEGETLRTADHDLRDALTDLTSLKSRLAPPRPVDLAMGT